MPKFGAALTLASLTAAPAAPAAGRALLYVRSGLPCVLNSAGAESVLPCPQFARKTADQAFTAVTAADVTDLSFPVKAGTRYVFEFRGALASATSTTGVAVAVNGPALGADGLLMTATVSNSTTTIVSDTATAYDSLVTGTGTSGTTPWWMDGFVHVAADGTFTLRAATEVAASAATIKKNSYGFLWAVG